MGVFDNVKKKAEELADQHSDKVEKHSDQGLDMAADKANSATGGKHADHIETGRSALDERVGDEGATAESATDGNPMVDDPE
ncbi:MAG: antitoxin, partial [Dermatophilaceae bacterium]